MSLEKNVRHITICLLYCSLKVTKEGKEVHSMTMTSNPRIEEIRRRVRASYDELNQLLNSPLANEGLARIYQSPGSEAWTIMENLAHITEFLPYWGDEIAKLVARPGQNFGRTQKDEGRLRAIVEHGSDSLAQARAALSESYEHLDKVLRQLQENDLELTGYHSTFGDRDLAWFIDEVVIRHLENHILQIKGCL
jgi:uncharacterized damage-inducible protein DinB